LDAGRFLARFFDDFLAFVHAAQEQPNDNQHNGHFDQGKTLRTGPMFDVCHGRLLSGLRLNTIGDRRVRSSARRQNQW
jgi:hypothetical protein